MRSRILAGAVHLYTAIGGLLSFFALVAISERRFDAAFVLLCVAYIVDSTDGMLARRVGVKTVLPQIDGETLDLIIDFSTYVVLPVFLMWNADLLPAPRGVWASVILLSGYYDFSRLHPLKAHGFYNNLPTAWNYLALYLYYLRPGRGVTAVIIAVVCALVALPLGYICLSRMRHLAWLTRSLVTGWILIFLLVATGAVRDPGLWLKVSLVFPLYYVGASWWLYARYRRGRLPLEVAATDA